MLTNIDSQRFKAMIISGAENLSKNKDAVDALNVFPVPDGDTGTNMSLTFSSASKLLSENDYDTVSDVLSAVSKATLRGARGNSGVILSQIFRGFALSFSKDSVCDVLKLKEAFKAASDTAYRAVMRPTEGTILTVIRRLSESALDFEGENVEEFFMQVIKDGNIALSETMNMLPQLKQAQVVDAGGQGLMCVFEGFLPVLNASYKPVTVTKKVDKTSEIPAQASISDEDIKFSYCTEFIINKNDVKESAEKIRKSISNKGDCMLVIDGDDIIKVHIHTNNPGFILEQAVKIGELVNIKIDNLHYQHNSIIENSKNDTEPKKEAKKVLKDGFSIVSVCSGKGIAKIFKDMGVDGIIEGGQTMNPSTDDILSAIEKTNSKNVIILPNNKNIILASQQAKDLSDRNVVVVESKSIPQGIASLIGFNPQKSIDKNFEDMTAMLSSVSDGAVTNAVRDSNADGKKIKNGDYIAVSSGNIVSVAKDVNSAVIELTEKLEAEDSDVLTLYYGKDVKKSDAEKLSSVLEEKYPDVDVCLKDGGQSVYFYVVSTE